MKLLSIMICLIFASCAHEYNDSELKEIERVKIIHFSHLKEVTAAKCKKLGNA